MLSYLHSDLDDYGVTKPVIYWQGKLAILTPTQNKKTKFGGPLPKAEVNEGALLHSVFSIVTSEIPFLKNLQLESIPLIFPFRHDGGSIDYLIKSDGSICDIQVDPPSPEENWPYAGYPLSFDEVSYECSALEPISEDDRLRLLHQDPWFDKDRDIIVVVPSKYNDPSLPNNLWNVPEDEYCVQCVFVINTKTNIVNACTDVD